MATGVYKREGEVPDFPGILVAMTSSSRNCVLIRWRDIAAASASALRSRPATAPRP
jgi:hypothetical protein